MRNSTVDIKIIISRPKRTNIGRIVSIIDLVMLLTCLKNKHIIIKLFLNHFADFKIKFKIAGLNPEVRHK
jgi:hypothetical protein